MHTTSGNPTTWDERNLPLDLTSLNISAGNVTLFSDGINADKKGTDYRITHLYFDTKLNISLAPAGGFLIIINPATS